MLEKLKDEYYAYNSNASTYDYVQFQLVGNIEASTPGFIT